MRAPAIVSVLLLCLGTSAAIAAGPAEESRGGGQRNRAGEPGDDIMASAFVALMEAAKSAQEDLKAIMAQVKAINEAKKKQLESLEKLGHESSSNAAPCPGAMKLRDCISDTQRKLVKMDLATLEIMRASVVATQNHAKLLAESLRGAPAEIQRMRDNQPPPARIIPPNPCRGWNVNFWKHCIVLMRAETAGNMPDAKSQAEINAQLDALARQFDSISEMNDLTSLRLQAIMDRHAKLTQVLANILKKISETSSAITRNLK
jgi:hypothetical protein